ncbi:MAG TPA: winged helix DNA-binding domain-containing protein [Candidatus Limnocylindria bacterium]
MTAVLSKRALNRSLLARQLLLERVELPALEVVERLVGMQAQNPLDPYTALWSRVRGFDPAELSTLLAERRAVRATAVMRTTIHLLSAADALSIRPLMQPVAERAWRYSPFVRQLDGVDVDAVVAAGLELLGERPHTASELGRRLQERWPDREPGPLAYAVRFLVPLVQPPPRGLWGGRGPAVLQTTTRWLGAELDPAPSIDELVVRYLAAFGPATARDFQVWSWLTGIREVVERLRPRLHTYRDERGRELFDVPDAPMPDPDTPAPVRYLPEFDNLLLSHHDRSRVLDRKYGSGDWLRGSVLVDGFVAGTWRLDTGNEDAVLTIHPFAAFSPADRAEVEEEAGWLAVFLAGDARTREIRIGAADA